MHVHPLNTTLKNSDFTHAMQNVKIEKNLKVIFVNPNHNVKSDDICDWRSLKELKPFSLSLYIDFNQGMHKGRLKGFFLFYSVRNPLLARHHFVGIFIHNNFKKKNHVYYSNIAL